MIESRSQVENVAPPVIILKKEWIEVCISHLQDCW